MAIIKQITDEKGIQTSYHNIKRLSYYPDLNKMEAEIAHYADKSYHDMEMEIVSNRETYIELNRRIQQLEEQINTLSNKASLSAAEKNQLEKLKTRRKALQDTLPKYIEIRNMEIGTDIYELLSATPLTIKEMEQTLISQQKEFKDGQIV